MPEPRRRRAIALRYREGVDAAPEVVATGAGLMADRIVETARRAGVPVRDDGALAEALAALDLGEHLPVELYRAAAEALAWAYRLEAQPSRT